MENFKQTHTLSDFNDTTPSNIGLTKTSGEEQLSWYQDNFAIGLKVLQQRSMKKPTAYGMQKITSKKTH